MFIIAYMTEGMCIMSVSPPHKKSRTVVRIVYRLATSCSAAPHCAARYHVCISEYMYVYVYTSEMCIDQVSQFTSECIYLMINRMTRERLCTHTECKDLCIATCSTPTYNPDCSLAAIHHDC